MDELTRLKKKWNTLLHEGFDDTDIDLNSENVFEIFIDEAMGCGPCSNSFSQSFYFDSNKDALAFLRFYNLPRLLHLLVYHDDEAALEVEGNLNEFNDADRKAIIELVKALDEALKAEDVSDETLQIIQDTHNAFFDDSSRFVAQEISFDGDPDDEIIE